VTTASKTKPRRVKLPPRLKVQMDALQIAGNQLSNIAFNLAHSKPGEHTLNANEIRIFDECRRAWDEALTRLHVLVYSKLRCLP
jgi:uncharacterized protein YhdP